MRGRVPKPEELTTWLHLPFVFALPFNEPADELLTEPAQSALEEAADLIRPAAGSRSPTARPVYPTPVRPPGTLARPHAPASPDHPSASDESVASAPGAEKQTAPADKPAIPAFAFPLSPATFAPGKGDNQPWHQKGNKSAHEKKIGAGPPLHREPQPPQQPHTDICPGTVVVQLPFQPPLF